KSITKTRGLPKVILLKSAEHSLPEEDIAAAGIDMVIESPTNAKKLIMSVAKVADLDENMLLEKYNKLKASAQDAEDDDLMVVSYDETGNEVDVRPKLFSLAEDREIGAAPVHFPLRKEPMPDDP